MKHYSSDFIKDAMKQLIDLTVLGVYSGHGPFGAMVLDPHRGYEVIGLNSVVLNNDPTAHAEVTAIRIAAKMRKSFRLNGCMLLTTCEPCPMCFGAIEWAGIDLVWYASDRYAAAEAGFKDSAIRNQLLCATLPSKYIRATDSVDLAGKTFATWQNMKNKVAY